MRRSRKATELHLELAGLPEVLMITTARRVTIAMVTLAAAAQSAGASSVSNPRSALAGTKLYVNSYTPAGRQADQWRSSRPGDARLMTYIAQQPTAVWMNGWASDIRGEVARTMTRARAQGAVPVFVAYNIPNRDCGSHAAGGLSASNYRKWVRDFAAGLRGGPSVVIVEPDAIAGAGCLSAAGQRERFALIDDAVSVFKNAGARVYIDAGHARWISADVMAARLRQSGIARADGFALNVSNFVSTNANVAYGDQLSARLGGKRYVIDTSRNGNGGTANAHWCNPMGQALGAAPTTNTGHANVDAFLWIKVPGESDGPCNGGPRSGRWWAEYALGLAKAARI